MIKKLLLISLLFLHFYRVSADFVDLNTARKFAMNFYNEKSLQLERNVKSFASLKFISAKIAEAQVVYYIFNSSSGFIIISADDNVFPVLAYSFEKPYSNENVSPEFQAWMKSYEVQILHVKNNNLPADDQIRNEWSKYLSDNFNAISEKNSAKSVQPLLMSTWDQGRFYNYLCPDDPGGQGGHVYSGCVATAMAQVMYYFRYPQKGSGSYGYYSPYGYLSADFENTNYNWYGMQNDISGKFNFDMAQLQLHCGIAVDMNYSPDGSGAYMWDAANAMKSYFGYSSSTQLVYKDNYTETAWNTLIKQNIDNKYPIQYAGFGEGAGHAFVLDGYQGNDFFHFNWGWSGHYNGYFYLNNLNPGYTFTDGQQAIINCYPASGFPQSCLTNITIINSTYGTIEDGSSPKYNYGDNRDCQWLIAPAEIIDNIKIHFERFNTEPTNDYVVIYDGETTAAPVLGTFSGNSVPADLESTGKKVLVRFVSNSSIADDGWLLTFNGKLTTFCQGITELTDQSGVILDGSDVHNYNNYSNCKWRIKRPVVSEISIDFPVFSLSNDLDFVKVYDETGNVLVATYTASSPPQQLSVITDKVLVFFRSDELNTDQGWQLNYTSVPLSVDEIIGGNVQLYPNPVTDNLQIEINFPDVDYVRVSLLNALGQLAYLHDFILENGNLKEIINVQGFPKGLYLLQLQTGTSQITKKVIVR